jgi:hypothetical protein
MVTVDIMFASSTMNDADFGWVKCNSRKLANEYRCISSETGMNGVADL